MNVKSESTTTMSIVTLKFSGFKKLSCYPLSIIIHFLDNFGCLIAEMCDIGFTVKVHATDICWRLVDKISHVLDGCFHYKNTLWYDKSTK